MTISADETSEHYVDNTFLPRSMKVLQDECRDCLLEIRSPVNRAGSTFQPPIRRIDLSNPKMKPPKNPRVNNANASSSLSPATTDSGNT